jgi:hypothetical protein
MQWPNRYYFPGLVARLEAAFPNLIMIMPLPLAECVCEYLCGRTDDFMAAMYTNRYAAVLLVFPSCSHLGQWHIAFTPSVSDQVGNIRYMNAYVENTPGYIGACGWTSIEDMWCISVGEAPKMIDVVDSELKPGHQPRSVTAIFVRGGVDNDTDWVCEEVGRAIWRYIDRYHGRRRAGEKRPRE